MNLGGYRPSMYRKVFIAGKAKGAGKTTLAMSAVMAYPTAQALVLMYDGGGPNLPPGFDGARVEFHAYAPSDLQLPEEHPTKPMTDKFKRPVNVGEAIIRDIVAIREAFLTKQPVKLRGVEQPIALPQIIILDGLTTAVNDIENYSLGTNNKAFPEDWLDEKGNPKSLVHYQRRLFIVRDLLSVLKSLPCVLVLIAHEIEQMKNFLPTGRLIPDLGGQLNTEFPKHVDASLACFSEEGRDGNLRFKVQTRPDGVRDWCNIRNTFGHQKVIDVTIDPKKPGELWPWERVFGRGEE